MQWSPYQEIYVCSAACQAKATFKKINCPCCVEMEVTLCAHKLDRDKRYLSCMHKWTVRVQKASVTS